MSCVNICKIEYFLLKVFKKYFDIKSLLNMINSSVYLKGFLINVKVKYFGWTKNE